MYHTVQFNAEFVLDLEMSPRQPLERILIRKGTRLPAQVRSYVVETAEGPVEVSDMFFEDGSAKFVFTPNTPVRQVWISAQSTSFKLEWDEGRSVFALPKTGEDLRALTERLLREQLNDPSLSLQ